MLLRNTFTCRANPYYFDTFECLEVTIRSTDQESLTLFVIYRPPSPSAGQFFAEFSQLLESANMFMTHFVICGDFNLHVDISMNTDTKTFNDILLSSGLNQLISQPTHSKGHTLDLVIVREDDKLVEDVKVIQSMPSDHAAITFAVHLSRPPATVKRIHVRKLQNITFDDLHSDILQSFESVTNLEELDLEHKVDIYNKVLVSNLDRHAPVTLKCIRLRPYAPWYNNELKTAKQNLRATERKWRKSKPRSTLMKEELKRATREY